MVSNLFNSKDDLEYFSKISEFSTGSTESPERFSSSSQKTLRPAWEKSEPFNLYPSFLKLLPKQTISDQLMGKIQIFFLDFYSIKATRFMGLPLFIYKEDDETFVFQWISGEKRLSLFINNDSIDYLKSWGSNIHENMEDGTVEDILSIMNLACWFSQNENRI